MDTESAVCSLVFDLHPLDLGKKRIGNVRGRSPLVSANAGEPFEATNAPRQIHRCRPGVRNLVGYAAERFEEARTHLAASTRLQRNRAFVAGPKRHRSRPCRSKSGRTAHGERLDRLDNRTPVPGARNMQTGGKQALVDVCEACMTVTVADEFYRAGQTIEACISHCASSHS